MTHDDSLWHQLDEAEKKRRTQTSIDDLYNDGYKLYCQASYEQAAKLFSQAAALAKKQGDLTNQCNNMNWEGCCYSKGGQISKALVCFLRAEQIGYLDIVHEFYNLIDLCGISISLSLPEKEIRVFLEKLSPYKISQIGGSKSMVLITEYSYLYYCGKYPEALAKAQEAFASQIHKTPFFGDRVYFSDLVQAYMLNGMIPEAWKTLQRWKKEGSTKFADTKRRQLIRELELLCYEKRYDEAYSVLQSIKAEEQYLGASGTYIDTLENEVSIGIELKNYSLVKSALSIMFKKHRNSDAPINRYKCYLEFARYCCAIYQITSPGNQKRMRKHVTFWLKKAEKLARHFDELMKVSLKSKEVEKIRQKYKIYD